MSGMLTHPGLFALFLPDVADQQHVEQIDKHEFVPMRIGLWRAIVTNLLNPKVVLFHVTFLPQFVNRAIGNITL